MQEVGRELQGGAWHGQLHFGEDWACYLGPITQQAFHAHVAVQIAVGLDESVTVQLGPRQAIESGAVLVAPLARHRVAPAASPVLLLYVDPRGRLGRTMRSRAVEAVVAVPEFGQALLAAWSSHESLPSEDIIMAALSQAFPDAATPPLDCRVARALTALEEQGGKGIATIGGTHAGLSAGRLRELAQRALGTSLAHFSLWRKLEQSLRSVAAGASLAEAAYAGGFADQAHLARTSRRMLGLTLSELAITRAPSTED